MMMYYDSRRVGLKNQATSGSTNEDTGLINQFNNVASAATSTPISSGIRRMDAAAFRTPPSTLILKKQLINPSAVHDTKAASYDFDCDTNEDS